MQHGILAFLDVIAVNESNDALSHPKAIELMTACRKKLEDSIAAVTERVNQGRKDLAPLYESMRPVMDVVLQTHDFLSDGTVIETVKSINANHDTLKDAVQGRELGGVCVCVSDCPNPKTRITQFWRQNIALHFIWPCLALSGLSGLYEAEGFGISDPWF